MAESLEWELVGDVMVVMTRPGPIPQPRWDNYISDIVENDVRLVFALVAGSITVNATQRKSAADVLKQKNSSAVVLTDSRVARGILTAISWLGANVKAIPWSDIDRAVEETSSPAPVSKRLKQLAEKFHQVTKDLAGD